MNKVKSLYIDILCFIIGPVLIAYNLFDFEFGSRQAIIRGDEPPTYIYYFYYPHSTQIFIALGVALVCWGFLRLYWHKNEGIDK